MPLMLAVQESGWASCPMSGIDTDAVHKVYALEDHFLPVLLIAVGRNRRPEQQQKLRLPPQYALI